MKKIPFKIVQNERELEELIQHCKTTQYCCFDFETSGKPFQDPTAFPTILGVSFQIGSAWIIPLGHYQSPFKGNFIRILRIFSESVLSDPKITKIAWNAKFEEKWLFRYGCRISGRLFDGMLGKYLLSEERPHGLKETVANLIPKYAGYEEENDKLVKQYGWAGIPLEKLAKYCALDCHLEFLLMTHIEKKLIKHGFYNLFRNMYMPRSRGLAECEYKGALIDKPYLENLMVEYQGKISAVTEKVRDLPIIRRYERKFKRAHVKKLISGIQQEIQDIRDDEKDNAPLLIRNREAKIQRIMLGELSKKESYKQLNFGSPKQMIDLLFYKKYGFRFKIVKYTINKETKKETTNPSTDEEVLLVLQKKDKSGFIKELLELRGLEKLYSTYIKGVYEILDGSNRVHPNFNLHGTVTGRLSCVEPNLQNIPRDTTAADIKRMFIPPPGLVLLEVDYSQAELRVVAELANEKTMIEWFRIGRNIHVASAVRANKCEERYDEIFKITKNEDHKDHVFWTKRKKRAKTINFGILYEQSPKKLKETLEKDGEMVSVDQAEQYMRDWFKDFPRIKKFMDGQHKLVKKQGYVETMFGFKRRLPNIYSSNYGLMLEAQRQSTNTPPQGTAAQFGTFSAIVARQQKRLGKLQGVVQEVYNVHDSLGFYVKPKYLHELVPKILEICSNPGTQKYFGFELKKVKMVANAEVGTSWGTLRGYVNSEDYLDWLKKANK